MVVQKDSRQMPKKQEVVSSKNYNDLVYAWFQVNSCWDKEKGTNRYIAKQDVVFTRIGEELDITRQTVSKRVNMLMDMGLLLYDEKMKRYELPILEKSIAMLVEKNTLRKLVSVFNDNAINTYVYLLGRYMANSCAPFEIVLGQIKTFLGISLVKSSNHIITDILSVLQELKLVKYEMIDKREATGQVRSVYLINEVKNKLEH